MAVTRGSAFGRSLEDLARAGQAPIVLHDCLKWLARFALTAPNLFSTAADKRKLLGLRQLYDSGKRPLRSKAAGKDPVLVANLLLLWLGSLPEPLFPAEYVPDLLRTQHTDCYEERVAAVRSFLKKTEPFILEALFPLFEFLHHHLINQSDRDAALREMGRLFAPFIFGMPQEYLLPAEDASLLSDTVELMIAEYRPLFTQPYGLNRYEQDAARAAAAAAAREAAAAAAQLQAAAAPGGGEDAADAAALTPPGALPALSLSRSAVFGGDSERELAEFWSPFSCFASSPLGDASPHGYYSAGGHDDPAAAAEAAAAGGWYSMGEVSEQQLQLQGLHLYCAARPHGQHQHHHHGCGAAEEQGMDDLLSSLLESAVAALFEEGSHPAAEEEALAAEAPRGRPVPVAARGAAAAAATAPLPVGGHAEFGSVESVSSEDWGSFSPTGFLLGDHPAFACKPAAAYCPGGAAGFAAPATA